jgi:beta-phosphoglucomutase-like phosphatase (HAD superfamily)
MTKDSWSGLDSEKDYPHIIGNSTTKHVEYLVRTYRDKIDIESMKRAFIRAAVRTVCFGKDPNRIEEVKNNLVSLGIGKLQFAAELDSVIATGVANFNQCPAVQTLINKNFQDFKIETENDVVRAAIDIYYARYHELLTGITEGDSSRIIKELELPTGKHLIEPMPGALLLLLLLKGKLKGKVEFLRSWILDQYDLTAEIETPVDSQLGILQHLASRFEQTPAKIAVVTSSIKYEADIVLTEIFKVFREQIKKLSLNQSTTEELLVLFSDYYNFYDAVITASDSSEIRLKPHRDLYSLALHRLTIPVEKFNEVIGFEDSESGNLAIRAAGVGMAIAVPFAQTSGHNLNSAAYIAKGGIPEVIFKKHLFLNHP